MKLDIEALAREAGVHMGPRPLNGNAARGYSDFARLIVERCAAECENTEPETYLFGGQMHDDAKMSIGACASAIRQLLEDK